MSHADNHSNGGLAGTISRGARRLAAVRVSYDRLAIGLVFFAGIITILHKAGVPVPHYAVIFGVSLGVAALLYEMNATTYALRNFWRGRVFSSVGWAAVWGVAFAYSMNQWVGAASETEGAKSNMHRAAFNRTADTRSDLATKKRELDRIEGRLAWMDTAVNGRAVRAIEAAQADIDNAQAHRFWKSTDGCRETKGPQTREFCGNVASWRAEKALASERATLTAELAPAKAALAEAQRAVSAAPVEVSAARNDLVILTRYAGLSEDDARTVQALGSILAISIFLSFATALKELEHLRETSKRTPIFGRLRRMLFGSDAADATASHEITSTQVFRSRPRVGVA